MQGDSKTDRGVCVNVKTLKELHLALGGICLGNPHYMGIGTGRESYFSG